LSTTGANEQATDAGKHSAETDRQTSLIDFPAELSVKAMGLNEQGFEALVLSLVSPMLESTDCCEVSTRESSQGKYLSVSVQFVARDQPHLESVYCALRAHDRVLYLL
jgi:putative lipoic acid-binding regulatory protein